MTGPGLQSSEGLTTSKGICVAAGPSSSPCGAPMGLLRDGRRTEQPSRSCRVFHTLILGVTSLLPQLTGRTDLSRYREVETSQV